MNIENTNLMSQSQYQYQKWGNLSLRLIDLKTHSQYQHQMIKVPSPNETKPDNVLDSELKVNITLSMI